MSVDRTKAPQPGPPRPYHFPGVTRRTLANGLRVLVAENHNAPLVAIRTLVHSGADHDTAEQVRRFYAAHFVPNNCSIVIAGDVETSKASDAA